MTDRGPPSYIWTSVRVELAEAPGFPRGSPSRAYMLRLPLLPDGTVHEQALRDNPVTAGFRRFWPNEPDRSGFILPAESGWTLTFQPDLNGTGHEALKITFGRLLPGDPVRISTSGRHKTYRVVDL